MTDLQLDPKLIDSSFRVELLRIARHAVDMLPADTEAAPADWYDAQAEVAFEAMYHAILDARFQPLGEWQDDAELEDRVTMHHHREFMRGVA